MKNSFEKELPSEYRPVKVVDATDKKLGICLNIAALGTAAAIVAVTVLAVKPRDFLGSYSLLRNLILCGGMFLYIVLHELVHGLAYKCLTGQKLTFGMTLTVAYCGVPDIFVYRRTALISLLAPFAVFLPVFLLPTLLCADPWDQVYASVMLGLHVGGCAGDLYDTFLYIVRFRAPSTLMQDTGPKQTFYEKED